MNRNSMEKINARSLASHGLSTTVESLDVGVYEMFRLEADIELIQTGGLSVNCQCLVVADSRAEAQRLLDETDPADSGCHETHLFYRRLVRKNKDI